MGGIGEFNLALGKGFKQGEVDPLLEIHGEGVVTAFHVVHHFIVEAEIAVAGKVGAIEGDLLLVVDDIANDGWDDFELFLWGFVGDTEGKGNAAAFHGAEVADTGVGDVGVGDDEGFTAEAFEAGGFNPDLFNSADKIIDDNKVTNAEGAIQHDGELTYSPV